jgi:hypothetical protein
MVTLRDEETQRKGVVGTLLFHGMTPAPDDQQHLRTMGLLAHAIPMYLPGGHICTENSMFFPLATAFLSVMDRLMKTRHKIHIGASNAVISYRYLRRRTDAPMLTISQFLLYCRDHIGMYLRAHDLWNSDWCASFQRRWGN